MVRPINIGHIKFSDVIWVNDGIEVVVSKEKTKQAGTDSRYRRHLYYNLKEPFVCPIFSLAFMLVCRSFRAGEAVVEIFLGARSEERFNHAIDSCLKHAVSAEEEQQLGAAKDLIGGYSGRKASASFAASIPGGPSHASWMNRGGWSMGVTDRYVHMTEGGGDEFLGRVLALLSMFDGKQFASLPARFLRKDVQKLMQDKVFPVIFEFYDSLPTNFHAVVPFLVARLVYSWDWIEQTFPRDHPIFASRLVRTGTLQIFATTDHSDRLRRV